MWTNRKKITIITRHASNQKSAGVFTRKRGFNQANHRFSELMDTVSKKKRSEMMRAVRSKNSKMEIAFRKELSKLKLRYRTNVSRLPSSPDIVFTRDKLAVFLDSCFWHGCRWHGSTPSSNKRFWIQKIEANKKRDKRVRLKYRQMGWKVLRFWEHTLKKNTTKAVDKIALFLGEQKYAQN